MPIGRGLRTVLVSEPAHPPVTDTGYQNICIYVNISEYFNLAYMPHCLV